MTPTLIAGLAMAALLALVLAVATRPWWRRPPLATQSRSAANVAAFRLRLAELDAEAASGLIPADEAASLRSELEARLLADAGDGESAPAAVPGARRPLATTLAIAFVALFALGGYFLSDGWRVQQQIASAAAQVAKLDPQIVAMVDKLASRLREKPEDAQGWAMLGRAYFAMQRYADAAKAYGEANARAAAPNAEWLTDEGEALAWAGGGEVVGDSAQRFEAALKLDPNDDKALWYGGLAAAQGGDFALARSRWQVLLARDDLPDAMRSALQERMKVLAMVEAQAATVESSEGQTGAGPAPAAAPAPPLRLHVTLAPELAAKIPAGATLFVFAKAQSGPQMPLAVQRIAAPRLPLDLTLDDSMAMAPALRLSQFERVAVTARLSAAGSAQAASGDLEGRIETGRAQAGGPALDIVIDHVLP